MCIPGDDEGVGNIQRSVSSMPVVSRQHQERGFVEHNRAVDACGRIACTEIWEHRGKEKEGRNRYDKNRDDEHFSSHRVSSLRLRVASFKKAFRLVPSSPKCLRTDL